MSNSSTDRNMLFGLLALQLDFVDRDQLISAMHDWLLDKSKSLGEILNENGILSPQRLALVDALVLEHLRLHKDDPQQSLAALSNIDSSVGEQLKQLGDGDVEASLDLVPSSPSPLDISTLDVGDSTSGGRFRILRPHAKGGLGEVSVALDKELNREVALKEIRARHRHDSESRSRFVLEAEITGGMEHPGIVPVYGLGNFDDGRPYYAMRFVRGDSLKDAIKRFHQGETPERESGQRMIEFRKLLGRFIDVCNAVEYAHSRGVLHRDLKPGNIMLGKYGETLVVDWGLAKAVGRSETNSASDEPTLRPTSGGGSAPTQMGSAIGTPHFMSPEQAEGKIDQLGPACDVYSLGATLYSLLTGQSPFTESEIGELLEQVKQGGFALPSQIEHTTPKALEAICLKAMALRPQDRYESPLKLAEEIERFLADEPVAVHAESFATRSRRWLRKHPRSVAGITAAVSVGVLSLIVVSVVVSGKNQQLAKANKDLDDYSTQVEKAIDVLGAVFADLDPQAEEKEGRPLRALLGERLDNAAQELDAGAISDPLVLAKLQLILGESLLGLAHFDKAISLIEKSRATFDGVLGIDQPDTLRSMIVLATAYGGAGKLDEYLVLSKKTLKLCENHLGPDHPDTLVSISNLASAYQQNGRFVDAMPFYEKAMRLMKSEFRENDPRTLRATRQWANAPVNSQRQNEGLKLLEEVLPRAVQELGAEHVETLMAMNDLAYANYVADHMDQAISLYEETLRIRRAKFGAEHHHTLTSMNNLAVAYIDVGRDSDAIPLLIEVVKVSKMLLGQAHPNTLVAMTNLGGPYLRMKQPLKAEETFREAYNIAIKNRPEHWLTYQTQVRLGAALRDQERFEDAEPELINGCKKLRSLIENSPRERHLIESAMENIVKLYVAWGKPDEADRWQNEIFAWRCIEIESLPENSPERASALAVLSLLILQKSDNDSLAETTVRECLTIREELMPDHWLYFNTKSMLGEALFGQQKFEEAQPLLVEGYQELKKRSDEIASVNQIRITEALERLVVLYEAWEKPDEAEKWRAKLVAHNKKLEESDNESKSK